MKKNISWKNFTIIFALVFVTGVAGWYIWLSGAEAENKLIGVANPAAVYCSELGYTYEIRNAPEGQIGVCIFPNRTECEEWGFYRGMCGKEFSYCALNGYDIKEIRGDEGWFEGAVCITPDGESTVYNLMDFDERLETGCQSKLIDSKMEALI